MDESAGRIRWRKTGPETSAADLIRECGRKLTDRAVWQKFQERFQGLIFLYLMRSLHLKSIEQDATGLVPDLAQEVYLRLVKRNGHALRSFRGTTEFAVMAFFARLSANVVSDHFQSRARLRRKANVVSIDEVRVREMNDRAIQSSESDTELFSSILSWIDIERVVEGDPDSKNARRNALIFKLHYIDGLSAAEIAQFPGFALSRGGVETVLARLRKRIQE